MKKLMALLLLLPVLASAEMVIVGVGIASCGKMLTMIEDDTSTELIFTSWVQGYLSGLNTGRLKKQKDLGLDCSVAGKCIYTDLSDMDGMMLWTKNYCKENPLDSVLIAMTALDNELLLRKYGN